MHTVEDLNLLTTLRHLLATRSVTATAQRMRLSQPAVSRALGRLRRSLGDPLFVRSASALVPTPRALALEPELEAVLSRLDDLLLSGTGFDPRTSRRVFVAATSDYTSAVLVGPLLAKLAEVAPEVTLRVVQMEADAEARLTNGSWDLAWAPATELSQAIVWTRLLDEAFVFVLRAGHPLAQKPLTLERYLSMRHLAISPGGKPGNPLDARLARMGHARRIVGHVPTFAIVPSLLASSDLGAVLPRRIADRSCTEWGLVQKPLPFETQGFSLQQAWHVRHRHDAGHAWFRKLVSELCRGGPGGR